MTTGINHLTFAVSDLSRSLAFYVDVIGCAKAAVWDRGAYLRAGDTWICLSLEATIAPAGDYTHIAFTFNAASLAAFGVRLRDARGIEWKSNVSEGDSIYFLDPDGHRLEAHVGSLHSRLASLRKHAYNGLKLF
jgi:glutathione S-transferase fosA5